MKATVVLTSEAARILGVTPETVRSMHRRGVLSAERTETLVRLFNREDVERLAEARAGRAVPHPATEVA
jgi:excisionase family DNA binding protein